LEFIDSAEKVVLGFFLAFCLAVFFRRLCAALFFLLFSSEKSVYISQRKHNNPPLFKGQKMIEVF